MPKRPLGKDGSLGKSFRQRAIRLLCRVKAGAGVGEARCKSADLPDPAIVRSSSRVGMCVVATSDVDPIRMREQSGRLAPRGPHIRMRQIGRGGRRESSLRSGRCRCKRQNKNAICWFFQVCRPGTTEILGADFSVIDECTLSQAGRQRSTVLGRTPIFSA